MCVRKLTFRISLLPNELAASYKKLSSDRNCLLEAEAASSGFQGI